MKKLLLLISLILATTAWGEDDSTYLLCKNDGMSNFDNELRGKKGGWIFTGYKYYGIKIPPPDEEYVGTEYINLEVRGALCPNYTNIERSELEKCKELTEKSKTIKWRKAIKKMAEGKVLKIMKDKMHRVLEIDRENLSMVDWRCSSCTSYPTHGIAGNYQCEFSSLQEIEEIFSSIRKEKIEEENKEKLQEEKEKREREKNYKI